MSRAEDVPTVGTGVVTFGETMALMSAPRAGPLAHARSLDLGIGGAESNVAIALRRLGADVTWIGRVGSDSLGDLVLREIAAEGITVVGIRDSEAPTGLMLKERRSSEEIRIWYYRSGNAGSRLEPADIDPVIIRSAALLHVTGITPALSDSARAATYAAIDTARAAGVRISFDLNYRGKLWSTDAASEVYRHIVPLCDLVFAGDYEAAIAVGSTEDPLELARRLIELGAGQAVIKLGARGAVAVVDGVSYVQPAVPIRAIDTVGAGDGFVAGYLAEYLLGCDVETRLGTATTVGAYACLVAGDWEGMPRRAELVSLTALDPVSR